MQRAHKCHSASGGFLGRGTTTLKLLTTKKILFILFAEFLTGLAIIIPIILNNSALGHTAEETSSTDAAAGALGACVPSAQQVTVIKAMVTSETANCTFANVTIGAIVGMQ